MLERKVGPTLPATDGLAFPALEPEAVAERLCSSLSTGLAEREAACRLAAWGRNAVEDVRPAGPLRLLVEQFADPLVLLLIAAAFISGVLLRDALDAAVILAIVVVNAALGFAQEYRAERALARLREIAAPTALVTRDGVERRLPAAELVPGDLIALHIGDRVPADARVCEAHHLAAAEALLTGEAFPADKSADAVAAGAPLAERSSMVHMGTTVAAGRGRAMVTATGRSTAMGAIADLLAGKAPPTPLQVELGRVGRTIGVIAVIVVCVVFLIGWLEGYPVHTMFLTAMALAVAAVPEGLPAVITITLARGVQRLARQRAIVRRLQAVEALGAATVVCTDKTGTLTRNEIRVQTVLLIGLRAAPEELPDADPRVARLAEIMALCNDATATGGNPIEVALLRSLGSLPEHLRADALRRGRPRLDEAAFDARRKLMSTLHGPAAEPGCLLLAVKGAPEPVLARSTRVETDLGPRSLDDAARSRLLGDAHALAAEGLRTLALAYRTLPAAPDDVLVAEQGLTLVGLVGLSDELRPEAARAVMVARDAGIRVAMVTGDHPETATAVARELRIATGEDGVMPGARLAGLTAEQLGREVHRYHAYARVDPSDKVKIVQAWQERGEIVAMTGDGVNDAPALHAADIGVAMGSGTDVSREAASIVLADDNFATLVSAIGEGRSIFANVRMVVHFLLTTNACEVLVMTIGFLAFGSLGEPLLATQILWVNLVTDGLPVLALAADPSNPDRMRRPPDRDRSIVGARQLWSLLWPACILAAVTLGALVYGHYLAGAPWPRVQTMLFTTLVGVQLTYAFSLRASRGRHPFRGGRLLVLATGVSLALQLAVVYLPPAAALFHTMPLAVGDWLAIGALNALGLAAIGLIRDRVPVRAPAARGATQSASDSPARRRRHRRRANRAQPSESTSGGGSGGHRSSTPAATVSMRSQPGGNVLPTATHTARR